MEHVIQLPMTKETASKLRAGDQVHLSGVIYSARDAAHERMTEQIEKGIPLPCETGTGDRIGRTDDCRAYGPLGTADDRAWSPRDDRQGKAFP